MFDNGDIGFIDTLKSLTEKEFLYFGGGKNIDEAITPTIIQLKEGNIALISFTQKCNIGLNYSSATKNRFGIFPLDLNLINYSISEARKKSDYVILFPHWSISESTCKIEKLSKQLAHIFCDMGANAIIGTGPHVPQGVEIYKGCPIVYSLGNFIFGHNQKVWGDNIAAKFIFNNNDIILELIPLAGRGEELLHPGVLQGKRAEDVLNKQKILNREFGTEMEIIDNRGYIKIKG